MIPRDVFYDRLEKHCKPCSEWDGVCLRGHALQSPTGCPMFKFGPIQATGYDPDNGRTVGPRSAGGGCSGCNKKVDPDMLPELTWAQVVSNFGESMSKWVAAGLPTVLPSEHERRYNLCKTCPQLQGYRCKLCKCVVYAKAKLQTEYCPLGGW